MSSNTRFFDRPQPAAVLKHELLRRYVTVYASKTGSQSAGKVSFVDGYAGAGLYDDGTKGSPAHALEVAQNISAFRQLRTSFVEKDQSLYERLVAYANSQEAADPTLDIRVMHGTVEQHLGNILQQAAQDPLFVFLDPFGVGIEFDVLTKHILGRSIRNYPKTEVLLNFSVQAIDRIGGLISSTAKSGPATLARLNRTLGGEWWQPLYQAHSGADRASVIATEYRARINAATSGGWGGWTVPVADSLDGRPEYLLLHFTQHRDGRWEFYEALTFATKAWREACHAASPNKEGQLAAVGQFPLEGLEAPVPFDEDETAWRDEIQRNARTLVKAKVAFVLQDRMQDLLGRSLGLARETHIRRALKPLYQEGLLANEPKGKLQTYVFAPSS
jgi:three-Cys-motif partner protein